MGQKGLSKIVFPHDFQAEIGSAAAAVKMKKENSESKCRFAGINGHIYRMDRYQHPGIYRWELTTHAAAFLPPGDQVSPW
jgi:hypothetical protein